MSDDPLSDTYGWTIEDDGEGSRNVRDDSGTLIMWVRWPPDAEHIVNALNDRVELQAERDALAMSLTVAKDALFEISIRPLSTDNAETAKRTLEQLARLEGHQP